MPPSASSAASATATARSGAPDWLRRGGQAAQEGLEDCSGWFIRVRYAPIATKFRCPANCWGTRLANVPHGATSRLTVASERNAEGRVASLLGRPRRAAPVRGIGDLSRPAIARLLRVRAQR